MSTLPTNFKDDILASSMGNKRKYRLNFADGSTQDVTIDDISTYDQTGSIFGASQINATNGEVNSKIGSDSIVSTSSDLSVLTQSGFVADALIVKQLGKDLTYTRVTLGSTSSPAVSSRTDADEVGKKIIEYIASLEISNYVKKCFVFSIYDSTTYYEWYVDLYRHTSPIIVATMFSYGDATTTYYKLHRNGSGADSVIPFSGGEPELLWTNSNPTASFSAQTVSLDFSKYDSVIISARLYLGYDYGNNTINTTVITKGTTTELQASSGKRWAHRGVTVSDTSIAFEGGYGGYYSNNSGSWTYGADNGYCIPYQIYGL